MTVRTEVERTEDRQSVHVPPPKLPNLDEVRKTIPPHCFEKNLFTSVGYLVQDLVILAALYAALPSVEHYLGLAGYLAWCWVFGIFACGLFVIGHDCGHGSFSEYEWVNDVCGHIAHASVLTPFWPWQKSHRQHHQYTSHVEKDKGHPWMKEHDFQKQSAVAKYFGWFPLAGWISWNPTYTLIGIPDGSHFWPWSRLFTTTTDRVKCAVSVAACALCAAVAFYMCNYSVYNWFKYYYVPLSFQGLMLVILTFLQHQNEHIEVYENDEWSFVRGQTQTIDRKYGLGIDTFMHHITDGHVAHHLFYTKIPHYHLLDATESVKKVLEPLKGTPYGYKFESTYDFFFQYLWSNKNLDYLVPKSKGIYQYRIGAESSTKSN